MKFNRWIATLALLLTVAIFTNIPAFATGIGSFDVTQSGGSGGTITINSANVKYIVASTASTATIYFMDGSSLLVAHTRAATKALMDTATSEDFTSITLSGTLSAEQVTSTDDATITDALDVGGVINAGSGNHDLTNAAGLLDGEKIQDDTIDDDSVDFADITGVDLTLTDCGAITSTGTITATVGFDIVGAADIDYGSVDVLDHTFVTDGTGDGEIVLPDDSIGDAEIAFDEVTGADLTLTDCGAITSTGTITATVGFDIVGAADIDYGSVDVTDHTFITDATGDAEIVLPDDSIGQAEIDFATVTGADLTLTDCGAITSTGTITATVGFDIVGAADIDYGSVDVTDHTFVTDGTGDAEIVLPDDSIGQAEIDFATVTGADLTLTDCGAITSTGTITATVGFDIVGAADIDYGSVDVTDHTFVTDGTGDTEIVLPDDSIGQAEIDFATVTGADLTLTDCGAITTAAGDITATAGTIFTGVGIDAVGAVDMDYGSVDVTDHTFATDGTGDAEIVLPNDSIGQGEIDFATVTGADLTLTDCGAITTAAGDITATAGTIFTGVGIDAVGAVDMDYGSVDVTDHTFATDGTGDTEIVLPNDSIGQAEIDFATVTGADLTLTDAGAITGTTVQGTTAIGHRTEAGGVSCLLQSITEEITIPVGQGVAGVNSATNMAPIGYIVACDWRVIDAAGGGVATMDIGVTGGDLDGLCDGALCAALNSTGSLAANHGATLALTDLLNGTATTITLTTNADVTVNDMIVEVTVTYFVTTPPPAI